MPPAIVDPDTDPVTPRNDVDSPTDSAHPRGDVEIDDLLNDMNNQPEGRPFNLHIGVPRRKEMPKASDRKKTVAKKTGQSKPPVIRTSGAKTARKTLPGSSRVKTKTRRWKPGSKYSYILFKRAIRL